MEKISALNIITVNKHKTPSNTESMDSNMLQIFYKIM